MDFLENLVIPATTQHLLLIKVILGLAMIIFLPFFGMLLGGTAFSVIFNSYGRKNRKPMYVRLAKDIIDKLAINRFVGVGLGIIPLLSITFCYAQLLYGQSVISISLLFVATLFLAIAVNFVYSYQSTFQIESLIETFKDITGLDKHELETKVPEEISDYEFDLVNTNSNAGLWGLVLLILTALFYAGGTSIALNSDRYQDFSEYCSDVPLRINVHKFSFHSCLFNCCFRSGNSVFLLRMAGRNARHGKGICRVCKSNRW